MEINDSTETHSEHTDQTASEGAIRSGSTLCVHAELAEDRISNLGIQILPGFHFKS